MDNLNTNTTITDHDDSPFSETVNHRYLLFSPVTHALLITGIPTLAILTVIVLALNGSWLPSTLHPPCFQGIKMVEKVAHYSR